MKRGDGGGASTVIFSSEGNEKREAKKGEKEEERTSVFTRGRHGRLAGLEASKRST